MGDLELVTHLRIGASGRCARKPWIQAACFAASAPELGLAGWLPRLLGTVLCEFPLGECGACACDEARASSGTRDRSVGRRRCIGLATWSGLCSHGSEAQGFWSSVALPLLRAGAMRGRP